MLNHSNLRLINVANIKFENMQEMIKRAILLINLWTGTGMGGESFGTSEPS